MRTIVIPTLEEASGKRAGVAFGACINPEFLREGTAVSRRSSFRNVIDHLNDNQVLVDLVRTTDRLSIPGRNDGICW